MTATIETAHRKVAVDLGRPLPISIPMRHGSQNPVAWYSEYPSMTPVRMEGFVGSVAEGGSVNTRDIRFNPHGNGTHTECIGHITTRMESIEEYLDDYWHLARLISVQPERLSEDDGAYNIKGDAVIGLESAEYLADIPDDIKALVIRTLPNTEDKRSRVYTGNNPPYVDPQFMTFVRERGIEHLLIDLPSVDRESDGGLMKAHRAFWYDQKGTPRMHATITEMIFVPEQISDGDYLLNLMVAPFVNDASPSKPVLYPFIV